MSLSIKSIICIPFIWIPIQTQQNVSLLTGFSLHYGCHIFLLLCKPGNILLDAIHCEFYILGVLDVFVFS